MLQANKALGQSHTALIVPRLLHTAFKITRQTHFSSIAEIRQKKHDEQLVVQQLQRKLGLTDGVGN